MYVTLAFLLTLNSIGMNIVYKYDSVKATKSLNFTVSTTLQQQLSSLFDINALFVLSCLDILYSHIIALLVLYVTMSKQMKKTTQQKNTMPQRKKATSAMIAKTLQYTITPPQAPVSQMLF